MKRAAYSARRRRSIRRWSFVAAFGATAVASAFGFANDDGIGSYFSTKAKQSEPAPIKQVSELTSGKKVVGAPIRPPSRLGSFIQTAKKPASGAAEAKKVDTGLPSRLSGFIGTKSASQAREETAKPTPKPAGSNVTLTKTSQPTHVRPETLSVGEAKPLRGQKQNAFLQSSRINRYSEPRALEPRALDRPAAKPLETDVAAKPAPILSPEQLKPTIAKLAKPEPTPPVAKTEPASPAKVASTGIAPKRVAPPKAMDLKRFTTTTPTRTATATPAKTATKTPVKAATKSPLAIRLPGEIGKDETSPRVAVQQAMPSQRPELTTRIVTPKAPVAAPARFADSNRKPLGPMRLSTARIRQASTPQPTDGTPALESPQQGAPAGLLESRLRDRRARNDRAEQIRVARAQQGAQGGAATALSPNSPFEIIDEAGNMNVEVGRSRLLKCQFGVFRTAIVDPSIVEAVQFTPTEVSLIGKKAGATQVTFWFENDRETPQTYLIQVEPSTKARDSIQRQYSHLEDVLTDIFPDSKVRLKLVADKLIVRGQAKDSAEAAQIMSIVRAQAGGGGGAGGGLGGIGGGMAARVGFQDEVGAQAQNSLRVINLLQVPGVQQVALRVKIAELSRSAARGAGIDLDADIEINGNEGALLLKSMLNAQAGNAPALIGQIDNEQIEIGLRWLQQHGVVRVVSEPTLVTMSGTAATFVAGGEFAVPTVVGTGGLSAVTTDFRAFGAIISFMPTVVDKDRIRLQVSPEFSKIDQNLTVGGTPGLQVRAVTSTVEMREGQTLAIAGLLDESLESTRAANLPWVERIINTRDTSRNETELIILVTPELVHPMEPEEVPPLPGFDVTEPTDHEFYYHSRLEGHPSRHHRSTIWPRLRRRYGAGGSSMISGPFGHGQ